MAEIGAWNGHQFIVSPKLIRGFTGLTIRGSSETEDKESDGQKYASRKNGNPSEISLTVDLNAFLGCDVKNEAIAFVQEANEGAKGYFYLDGKKLLACQLMLTKASVTETEISPGGKWTSCKVSLTMRQCAKFDGALGGNGGNSGGSKKASVKASSPRREKDMSGDSPQKENGVAIGLDACAAEVKQAQNASADTKKRSIGLYGKIGTGIVRATFNRD